MLITTMSYLNRCTYRCTYTELQYWSHSNVTHAVITIVIINCFHLPFKELH